jgi:hypothetical protein
MKGRLPVSVAASIACPILGANGEWEDLNIFTPLPRKTAEKPEPEAPAMASSVNPQSIPQ